MVIWFNVEGAEDICTDNNEKIRIWKTLLARSNHGRSWLSNGRTREIRKQTIWHPKHLNTSVSNVICSLLFGKRFEYEDAKFKHLIILLNKLLSTSSSSSPAFIFPILRHLTKSRFIKVQNIFADIDEFTSEIIVEHKRNFDGNNVRDFIDGFLLEQKQAEENTTFTGNF